ncbi:MAG: hypothetical protein ACAH59_05195 [Pseudobdellovibrionaceae bacterium]
MRSLIFSIAMVGLVAQAQDAAKMMDSAKAKAANVMSSCKEDQVKLCPDMKTAEQIQTCLKGNYEKLTPACKESMKAKK